MTGVQTCALPISKSGFSVAYIDLDGFKNVNDQFGHDVGDKVLCEVAQRLREALFHTDIISRIGGDEFTVLLPKVDSYEAIEPVADKLVSLFDEEFRFRDASVQIGASIGFSVYPHDGEELDILLKKADAAMYKAKKSAKNSWCVYSG